MVDGMRGSGEGKQGNQERIHGICVGINNGIAPERSQKQPFSLYLDSAKCNLDENTKAPRVRAQYKCVAQKVKPVPLLDGSVQDA